MAEKKIICIQEVHDDKEFDKTYGWLFYSRPSNNVILADLFLVYVQKQPDIVPQEDI